MRHLKRSIDGYRNERLRRLDIKILWPACIDMAEGDLEDARMAFRLHIGFDPAWSDLTPEERERRISNLT